MIESLRKLLRSRQDIDLAIVFGSAAHGTMGPESDIDLAVRWTGAEPNDKNVLLAKIERACGRTIDIVDLDSAPPQLRFEIARSGVVIVERTPGIWSEAKARAFIDWWDFRPIANIVHRAAIERLTRRELGGSR